MEIDAREFAEWMVYFRMNPTLSDKLPILFAHLCSVIASVFGGKAKRISDFLIDFNKPSHQRKSQSEIKTKLQTWLGPLMKKNQGEKNGNR